MIAKALRIARKGFSSLFKASRSIRGDYVSVHYSKTKKNKLAVLLPKKVIKGAVSRHRYKRVIVGVFNSRAKQRTEIITGFSLIIRVHRRPPNEKALKEDLIRQFEKIGV